jgi:hypothetical protein
MNFHRIALIVAVLAVPCSANAFWFGGNGSCGGCNSCAQSCGSHGGSFGGCFGRIFSHGCCGSHGGHSMGCGCESSCDCGHESCGCSNGGHEGSSCGCGGEVKGESHSDDASDRAPAPAKEEKKEAAKNDKK